MKMISLKIYFDVIPHYFKYACSNIILKSVIFNGFQIVNKLSLH